MFILYAFDGKTWKNYAQFQDKRDYKTRVNGVADKRIAEAKTPEDVVAAELMKAFVSGGYYYSVPQAKTVLRALRRFDEVGISNDIYDALETALKQGLTAFALVKDGQTVGDCLESPFDKEI